MTSFSKKELTALHFEEISFVFQSFHLLTTLFTRKTDYDKEERMKEVLK